MFQLNWYLSVLRKYAVFRGRARRKEYWIFQLLNIIIMLLLYSLFYFTGDSLTGYVFMVIYFAYSFGVLIPSLAVLVRRLHDINKSGWWFFISFIPVIGGIWLFVLTCLDGTKGPNTYGPDPKETGGAAVV